MAILNGSKVSGVRGAEVKQFMAVKDQHLKAS